MIYNRTTAIIGAGVILDFDFNGMVTPSTRNITDDVVGLKIQGFALDELDLIKQVYDLIVAQSRAAYLYLSFIGGLRGIVSRKYDVKSTKIR